MARRSTAILLGTAVAVVLLDALTKSWAIEHANRWPPLAPLPGLRLSVTLNTGSAFGLGHDTAAAPALVVFAFVVLAGLGAIAYAALPRQPRLAIPLGLAVGGTLGNLADRLLREVRLGLSHPPQAAVVDFIVLHAGEHAWPAFNLADVAIVVALLFLVAIMAPLVAPTNPFDPASLNLMNGFTPPMTPNMFTGESFVMGTDDQGRDLLSAIIYGLWVSLFVGVMSVMLAMGLGVSLGLTAGYVGGWLDNLIMRIADIQLTFPSILIAMLIFGVLRGIIPPDLRDEMAIFVLITAIGLSEWVPFARTVRATTMVEKEKEYVQAARLIGLGRTQIMWRHILPNVLGPVLVIATITLALAIIAEATLSFLGVGAPPTEPSLGTLIRIGQDYLFSGEWWILTFPAVTLLALALSVNLLGDWLKDTLNPRLK